MDSLEDLVRRYLASGDEEAVEDLVRRTRPRLRRVARRIVRDADADDCVQTAYLSLAGKRGGALDAPILPWLVRAVIRIAYRHKARYQRDEALARKLGVPRFVAGPVDAAMTAEELQRLRRCVDRLPDTYRDAVVLHHLEGLSTAETAALLGTSEANIRKRLERGRRILRSALGPRVAGVLLPMAWLCTDTAAFGAFLGGVAMQKTAAVATVACVLALTTGVVVWRTVADAPAAGRAESAGSGPASGAEAISESPVARPARLRGHVTDAAGQPIAGALVMAMPPDMDGAVDPNAPEPPVVSGRTDAGGVFDLEFQGDALLFATAQGFCPLVTTETEIVLAPAGSLVGTVMDARRAGVAGARVRWMGLLGGVRVERQTVSDPDGGYRLDELPTSDAFREVGFGCGSWIDVQADGFGPLLFSRGTVPRGANHPLDLVLVAGGRVDGVVVDAEDDAPLADARVVLLAEQPASVGARPGGGEIGNPFAPGTLATARTSSDGSFALENIPATGFHELALGATGFAGLLGRIVAEAPGHVARPEAVAAPEPGATVHVKIVCWPVAEVSGRVVDAVGAPRQDVDVWAHASERSLGDMRGAFGTQSARTDREGRYRLDRVPATRSGCKTTVFARPRDWPRMIPGAATVDVQVRAGEVTRVPDIVVGGLDMPSVDVVVTDEAGRPVPDAAVSFAQVGFAVKTDHGGRARIYKHASHGAGPPPHYVYVRTSGYAPQVLGPVEPALVPPELRVVLSEGRTIEGRVVWRDGQPAGGARVWVFNGAADAEEVSMVPAYAPYPQSEGLPPLVYYGSADVACDGTFVVAGVPDGPCHVHAIWGRTLARLSDVVAGARGLVIELPADPPIAGTVLSGTVTEAATGSPPVCFEAAVYNERDRIEATYPTLGAFRIENVSPGPWTLQVSAKGYTADERLIDVTREMTPMAVRLRRAATVSGRVRNESGVDFSAVSLVDEGGNFTSGATLDGEGSYRAVGLPPGRYVPVAWPRGKPIPKPYFGIGALVVGEADQERTFDFVVRPSGYLFISTRLEPTRPPDGTLRVEDEAGEPFLVFRGRRALFGVECFVPVGRYRITVVRPGADPLSRVVDVRSDAEAKAVFDLR